MDQKRTGVYEKFDVKRKDGGTDPGGKHEHCFHFILDVDCDPHAIPALMAYAESCEKEYPLLARDLRNMADIGNSSAAEGACIHGGDYNYAESMDKAEIAENIKTLILNSIEVKKLSMKAKLKEKAPENNFRCWEPTGDLYITLHLKRETEKSGS